jgi:hypothetical protein
MGRFAYFSRMGSGATDRRLGVAAAELSAIGDLAEFRDGVLPILRRLIAADMASYNEISHSPPGALVTADPVGSLGLATPERQRRFAELVWQNPLAAHSVRTGDSTARRMSDFITSTALHRLELYDEYYRELGTEYQLAFTVPADACLIGITLSRTGVRDFADEERELLERVRALVIPLYLNLLDRDRLRAVLAAIDQVGANAGSLAVLLVHASGALEAAHERAEPLLSALITERVSLHELHAWISQSRRRRATARRPEPLALTLGSREMLALYVRGGPGTLDAVALCASPAYRRGSRRPWPHLAPSKRVATALGRRDERRDRARAQRAHRPPPPRGDLQAARRSHPCRGGECCRASAPRVTSARLGPCAR